ncbi:MAG: RHS repeat-associated core domain-containing protein, partial [Candidatus Eisenbacteria bacterium]|nr:RHS repeat-associated core domain-containing protein [Candidatus Eisenbacteria bacterium]
RVGKVVSRWRKGRWSNIRRHAFPWDGWNPGIEIVTTRSAVTTNQYFFGEDLSGSLQGAGGIGGLLCASLGGSWAFYHYQANGNVMALTGASGAVVARYQYNPYGKLLASSGALAARYSYSPYGKVLSAAGALAAANPIRYSSKYTDMETELVYYGYRFYSPELGRFLSRDPLENLPRGGSFVVESLFERRILERARSQLLAEGLSPQDVEGILGVIRRMLRQSSQQWNASFDPALMSEDLDNLYRFCANDPLNAHDFLGLESKDEKYQKLINAAKAAWEAAKYAVPGSEFPALLEAFGGCNTLGLINAWADKKHKECLCNSSAADPFDDPECKKWKDTKDWLTDIWNKQCK